MSDHPWQSARDEFDNQVIPKLCEIGKEIGNKAREGDELCVKIVRTYSLLYRSFDPINLILLQIDLKEYEERSTKNEKE